jgi:hypothetical protein
VLTAPHYQHTRREFGSYLDSTKEGRLFSKMDPLQIVCIYEALEEDERRRKHWIHPSLHGNISQSPPMLSGQFVTV